MFQNLSPSIIAEIVALFSAAFLLYNQPKPWRYFILFLAVVLLIELGGRYIKVELKEYSNQWLYNVLLPIYFPFYLWVFSFIPLLNPFRKIINYGIFSFLLFAFINLAVLQGFYYFNGYTYIIGSVLLISCCLLYYFRAILYPGPESLFAQPAFWLASGVFVFQAGSLYTTFFQATLQAYFLETGTNLNYIIMQFLNIWLYSFLIIAFLKLPKVSRK